MGHTAARIWGLRLWTVWLLVGGGCVEDRYWETSWPANFAKVVIVTDALDHPLETPLGVFGPNDPIQLSIEGSAPVRIHVWLFPETIAGYALADCGIGLGGDGEPVDLTLLAGAYATDPAQLSQDALPPFRVLGEGEPPPSFDLHYLRCRPSEALCRNTHTSVVPISTPADSDLFPLVAISDQVAFLGFNHQNTPLGFELIRVEGDQRRSIPAPPGFESRIQSLAYDGTQVLGTTFVGQQFTLSVEGVLTSTSVGAPDFNRVAAKDGWVLEYGLGGLKRRAGPTLPPFPEPEVRDVLFLGPGRLAVLTSSTVYSYDGGWTRELEFTAKEDWTSLGGTAARWGVISVGGAVRFKTPPDPAWSEPVVPWLGQKLYQITDLGPGRFLFSGQNGLLAIYSNGRSCALEALTTASITSVRVAPSGRVAFAGTNDLSYIQGDHVPLLRLELPP